MRRQQPRGASPFALSVLLCLGASLSARAEVGVLIPEASDETTAAVYDGVAAASDAPVMPRDRFAQQVAAAARLGVECAPDDLPCLSRLAGLASLEALVVARVDGEELTLDLVDTAANGAVARARGATADARDVAARLFSPAGREARLFVTVEPRDARLFLDEEELGGAPEAGLPVRPGRHVVRAEVPGSAPVEREVFVQLGESATLALVVEGASAAAPVDDASTDVPVLVWVGAAGAAVGAVTLAVGLGGIAFGQATALDGSSPRSTKDLMRSLTIPLVVASVAGAGLVIAGAATSGVALLTEP